VRDLGGLPLEGGGETRFGVAVRADSIRTLTDEGWRPVHRDVVRRARDEDERERRRRIVQPAGTTMAELLGDLDVREYLTAGGAAECDLDTLVVKLRP
jgi:protein-tyrosine phosphatase